MRLNKKDFNIILASKSPRRKALMKELGYSFQQKSIEVDESYPSSIAVEEVAEYLSKKKAQAYLKELNENDLLITSDTTVCLKNKVLGKPKDIEEAKQMLNELSGNQHVVISGICMSSIKKQISFSVSTQVTMKHLSKEEIDHYINTYQPFDKAGSYGIQEWIGFIGVKKISGSFYNVMGLPVKELYEAIEQF